MPQVLVTDIRMPPNFQSEGIDAAKEVRKRQSRHRRRDPLPVRRSGVRDLTSGEGAGGVRLPVEGPSRRRRPAGARDPDRRERWERARPEDHRGTRPAGLTDGDLSATEEELLRMIAEGRPHKRIAAALETTPAAVRPTSRSCS